MSGGIKFFVITACVCLSACAPDNTNQTADRDPLQDTVPAFDSTHIVDSVDSVTVDSAQTSSVMPDTSCMFLQQWQNKMRQRDQDFSLARFYPCSMRDIDRGDCNDWGDLEITDNPSPDSTWSAYTVPGHSGGEPDTYVYLYNNKRRERCMLDVIGTCCSFEDCGWLDERTLIVVGYDKYAPEEKYPGQKLVQGFYVIYDLVQWTETTYCSLNYFHWR